MSRIAGVFAALRDQSRAALIPFVTAGDPEPSATLPLMHAMVEAGADIIELGVPFSDPFVPCVATRVDLFSRSWRITRRPPPSRTG